MNKNTMIIQTKVEVKTDQIETLFVSALEGNYSEWIKSVRPIGTSKGNIYKSFIKYGFTLIDFETNKKHVVSPKRLKKALSLMQTKEPQHFASVLKENTDQETADVFMQLCCFKQTVYG